MKTRSTNQSSETLPARDAAEEERHELGRGGSFPIVGVGASAGGLEAFTQMLSALPPDTGMGFVLVQHLDPDHESALTQILARATSLPVHEITNDEPVLANHVYIIPRDSGLSIAHGVLKLEPRKRTRSPPRPIDSFFEALAQDQGERAVGVVLSGTANDGTLGLEAIKAEGGITFAQDDSAKHDGMPRSAVAAGCVDLVLSPVEIARELARIAKHPFVAGQPLRRPTERDGASATAHQDDQTREPSSAPAEEVRSDAERARDEGTELKSDKGERKDAGYKKILLLLRNHYGVDFSLYKSTTLERRITRRVVLNKQNTLEGYAGFLQGNAKELETLYSDVLISVTSFFRNPETFDVLQRKVLAELVKHGGDDPLRCWVLGCSTGQEAYSIAMAFVEAAEKAPRMRKLQVFATDLNDALLEKARHGLYAKSLAGDVTPERLQRFFVEEGGGYRVSKMLREMVVFARQNVIADPPFSRMDLISCRNVLIYLEPSLQRKVLPTFHYALRPNGFLLLGASESISGFTDLFETVDKKHRIYSKKPAKTPSLHLPLRKEHADEGLGPGLPQQMLRPGGPERSELPPGELDAQREADRITVSRFAPPGVLVNSELQILQFRGSTGAFLEPPIGKPSFEVLKMAREGLMLPLRSAIDQAKKDNKDTRRENIRVERGGKTRAVNVKVIPLKNLRERCFLILFEEAEARRSAGPEETENTEIEPRDEPAPLTSKQEQSRIKELETELSETRRYVQATQEEHEAANEALQAAHEEVQSANEELQSSNEELQSVNEELETSKEELESTNEELTTVNDEMSNRNVELNRLNDDLTNLQTSTELAIVLVGRDLTIRRFSPQAEKQFHLLNADAGRPLGNIRHNLVLDDATQPPLDLERLTAEVISDVRAQEREVRDKNGRWHSLRVRPYRTLDDKVDGAVLVLVDIDALKRSERAIIAARDVAETTIATVREPLLVLNHELRVETANRAFYRTFRTTPAETVGTLLYDLGNGQWDIPRLRELLGEMSAQGTTFEDFEVERSFKSIGTRTMLLNARRMVDPQPESQRILLAIDDVTDRKRSEEIQKHLAAIVSSSDDAIISKDLRGIIQSWNEGAKRLFGYTADEAVGKPVTLLIPPDRVDEERGILERIGRGETIDHYETVRLRKDGSVVDVSLTISPMRDTAGRVTGVSKIARDISDRKRFEDVLRQRSADLLETDRRKNEFLAMLGHELRNPLSALMYAVDLLGTASGDRARSEKLRGVMVRQTQRIATLLDQLLDIARVISGKVELSKDRVELADVVRAGIETVTPLLEARKQKVTVSMPTEESPLVMGDAIRLAQVVENLLTNAVKYTNEGGQIEICLDVFGDTARIIVRDTGIGMSAEFLPHVFEVFSQAPRALDRAKGGLGLGLPLVKRLVEMHGGQVAASSPGVGQGSEFIVTLPRLDESGSKERLSRDPAAAEPAKSRPRKILVVDDEEDVAFALAERLEEEGHQTLAVNDGPAALAAVRKFAPEVVLLDLGLPEMNGYEVARKLREEHADKKIFLIAVTGYQKDAARLMEAGFNQHLIKPPKMQTLSAMLAALDRGGRAIP
jgi:two-component system, chemotaxis family, CheB/CheR fusion protein